MNISDAARGIRAAATIAIPFLLVSCAQTALSRPTAAPAASAKLEPLRYDLGDDQLQVQVVDLSPRFLAFHAAARDEPDPGRRFELWREYYGFAAVPPGPRGEAMALDDNAFSYGDNGQPVVAVPLEMSRERRELVFVHEMTHAVTWRLSRR